MAFSATALFQPELLDLHLSARDFGDAIGQLSQRFVQQGLLGDAPEFTKLVLAREKICSTVLGSGIAFPHARTNLVGSLAVAIGRCPAGVRFAPEQEPTHLIFLIGTPISMVREYLDLVGQLARRLRADSLRQQLLQAGTPEDFMAALDGKSAPR